MSDDDALSSHPFSWARRADSSVIVSYHAAPVTALRGSAATRFLARVDGADELAAQQLMARATRNFKRGNERLLLRQWRAGDWDALNPSCRPPVDRFIRGAR